MRRFPSNSVRTVAFAVVFCALSVAGGCGRETFDLLPNEPLVLAGQPPSAGARNDSGAAGTAGAGAAGKASGGTAGKLSVAGFGGRISPFPPGGSAGDSPCPGEAGCADEVLPCMDDSPLCTR